MQWGILPVTNTLNDLDPDANPLYNADYPSRAVWRLTNAQGGITNGASNNNLFAYSGMAWDEENGVAWLPLQGGHGDYGGNEPYKVRLYDDSPAWEMPRGPSGSLPLIAGGLPAGSTPYGNTFLLGDEQEHSGVYADGRPRAMHSYRLNVHVPGVGMVATGLGGIYASGQASLPQTWLMDEATCEWTRKNDRAGGMMGGIMGSAAAYDKSRHCVWYLGSGASSLWHLNLSTWVWTPSTAYKNTGGDTGLIYADNIDTLIEFASYYALKFQVWNPATQTTYTPTVIGTMPAMDGNTGVTWCSSLGAMVVSGADGALAAIYPGADPFTDPWTVGSIATTGSPSPQYTGGGTLNRFVYMARLNGFFLLNAAGERPYFLPLD